MTNRLIMRWMGCIEDNGVVWTAGLAIVGAKVVMVVLPHEPYRPFRRLANADQLQIANN